ncbi:MAG: tyrosine-type recombinase/integrase [Acidimicrobiia bacterium]
MSSSRFPPDRGFSKTLPGSVATAVVDGVVHLDPKAAAFDAMIDGWTAQMASRGLKRATIDSRVWLLRRFAEYTNEYPWAWLPGDLEDYCSSLRSSDPPRSLSTLRGYQAQIGLFCDYVCDARYGWVTFCEDHFASHPVQICTEANRTRHTTEYEGDPRRRPFTPGELQAFFDYADDEVDRIRAGGRKGALAALRDSALLKVVYAWGLRRREAVMLDVVDIHRNAAAPAFGDYGALFVRWGKAKRGGPPRRRTVLSVYDWAVEALTEYVEHVRPAFGFPGHPALWVTERGSRISARSLDERFATYRDALGLPPELDLHCLRHSYVTHLVESGYPERFVTEQVGHSWGSTTAIYCSVSDDYKNQVLAKAIAGAFRRPEEGNA